MSDEIEGINKDRSVDFSDPDFSDDMTEGLSRNANLDSDSYSYLSMSDSESSLRNTLGQDDIYSSAEDDEWDRFVE